MLPAQQKKHHMDVQFSELLSRMKTSCVVYFFSTDGPVEQYYLNGGNAYVYECQDSRIDSERNLFREQDAIFHPDPEHAKTVVADSQYWRTPFVRKLFGFDDPKTGNHRQRRKRERAMRFDLVNNFTHCGDSGMFLFGVCLPCTSVTNKRLGKSYQLDIAYLTKEHAHPRLIAEVERCLQDPNLQALYNHKCLPLPKNLEDVKVYIEYRATNNDFCWSRAVVLYEFFAKIPLDISEETLMQCTPCVPPQWSVCVDEQLYSWNGEESEPIDERLLWDCFDKDGRINDEKKYNHELCIAARQFIEFPF